MTIPSRIVAFGSSSVHGRGDPSGGGFVGRLRAWHESKHRKNLVYNLGINGDTLEGMLKRFSHEVPLRDSELILLYPGLNDVRRKGGRTAETRISIEKYKEDLSSLLEISKGIAQTVFISAFPIDETRTTPYSTSDLYYLVEDANRVTEIACGLCNEKGIPYLPVYENWSRDVSYPVTSVDGLHACGDAHERLFQELSVFLCGLFGEGKEDLF